MKLKLRQNKGLTVKDWVIISLMFSAIFSMGVIAIGGFQKQSGLNINLTDPTIEGHYQDMNSNLNDLNQSISSITQNGGLSLATGFQAFFGGTVSILNIVLGSMASIPAMFVSFAADFGIDSTVASFFFLVCSAIISVIVIFAILNSSKTGGRL